ncbi:Peroxisomal membrane protein PEX30 [Candida viswanathii]|uniref:Peroxisomal membrane protein PEX30 n=1 Tax=Candida viswanathii TaxID=5486 RepID=A0A367YP98_9ASCO|nr:Peroxisomal membrane protein PEX30 [Candida viswanathii]
MLNSRIVEEANLYPTLDDVVQALTATCIKADLFLLPITSLSLTAYDIKRLLFTTLFLTPVYLIVTFLLINQERSCYSAGSSFTKPVRFTYVIYENQRKWLGIGWSSNLLSYERTPWTDEFLNESSSIDTFKLPNSLDDSQHAVDAKIQGATWRWVDKTWRLDLTNDGAITLPSSKRSKTTANPASDEGFIYYDNTWKKPSTEDTFSNTPEEEDGSEQLSWCLMKSWKRVWSWPRPPKPLVRARQTQPPPRKSRTCDLQKRTQTRR